MNKKQDKKAEKEFFDRASFRLGSEYVFTNEEQFMNYNEIFELLAMNECNSLKVLDVGAGRGSFSIRLAKMGYQVTTVDLTEKLCKVIEKRASDNKLNIAVLCGDAEKLPFKDKTFDACFVGNLLHHFPDCSRVVNELYRVVRDKLYIVEPNGSNIVLRFSRWLGSTPPLRKILSNPQKKVCTICGGATVNQTIHGTKTYIHLLNKSHFKNIQILTTSQNYRSSFAKEFLKEYPYWIQIMYKVRNLLWRTGSVLVPKMYSDTLVLFKMEK